MNATAVVPIIAVVGRPHRVLCRVRLVVDPCGHCQDAYPYFPDDLVEGRTILSVFQVPDTAYFFGPSPADYVSQE
jgi:hypothetical protein